MRTLLLLLVSFQAFACDSLDENCGQYGPYWDNVTQTVVTPQKALKTLHFPRGGNYYVTVGSLGETSILEADGEI